MGRPRVKDPKTPLNLSFPSSLRQRLLEFVDDPDNRHSSASEVATLAVTKFLDAYDRVKQRRQQAQQETPQTH